RGLHAIARTTDVQVDLVVARPRTEPGGRGELLGIRAAELERDRMLRDVEAQQALCVAAQERARGDHLRVQQGVRRERARQKAKMPVGPIHHRGRGNSAIQLLGVTRHVGKALRKWQLGVPTITDCTLLSSEMRRPTVAYPRLCIIRLFVY